jgi:hypothetical protein
VFGGLCSVANLAGSEGGIFKVNDGAVITLTSDNNGTAAVAEHRHIATCVDETAVATGRMERHERAVDCITLGNAAEVDAQRRMPNHGSRRHEL